MASEIERVTEPGITKNHANAEGETAKLIAKISTLTKKFLSILILRKTSSKAINTPKKELNYSPGSCFLSESEKFATTI
jgi:hypothetical protein